MVLPLPSAAVVRLPYDLWLVTGSSGGSHSRARTDWVSLAHWLGRIQPTQGMLRTQPKLPGDFSQSGWSCTLSEGHC